MLCTLLSHSLPILSYWLIIDWLIDWLLIDYSLIHSWNSTRETTKTLIANTFSSKPKSNCLFALSPIWISTAEPSRKLFYATTKPKSKRSTNALRSCGIRHTKDGISSELKSNPISSLTAARKPLTTPCIWWKTTLVCKCARAVLPDRKLLLLWLFEWR